MSAVSFVLQADESVDDLIRFACATIEQYLTAQTKIWVRADESTLTALSSVMWHYRETSFLPHYQCFDQADIADDHIGVTPIVLSASAPDRAQFAYDLVLNLDDEICAEREDSVTVLELVPSIESLRAQSRAKFKAYRQAGYAPQMIDS